jgi:hypothetical protein
MAFRSFDREAIEAEIDRVRLLGLDELRTLGARHCDRPRPLPSPRTLWHGSSVGTSRSRPSAGFIRIRQSFWTPSHGATSRERTAPGASSPAPCLCANTRASGTPSPLSPWVRVARGDLHKPLHHRARHHRDGLERSALLRLACWRSGKNRGRARGDAGGGC